MAPGWLAGSGVGTLSYDPGWLEAGVRPSWLALTFNSRRNQDNESSDTHTSSELVKSKGIITGIRRDNRNKF